MIYIRTDLKNIEKMTELYISENLGIEIPLADTEMLNSITPYEIERAATHLLSNKIPAIVHLPMYGTNIGVLDRWIREYSININLKALKIANELGASKAVFHNGLNPLEPASGRKKWYKIFKDSFEELISFAEDKKIEIVSENVWDCDEEYFDFLVNNFKSKYAKMCFDIGHANIYLKRIEHEEFIKRFRNEITHLHIHDNMIDGEDTHLHINDGKIDFYKYFGFFNTYLQNLTYTLEVKNDNRLIEDIHKLREMIKK